MESFGSYLRAQREKKGIRLEEIASITKINLQKLQMLEEGRFEELPSEPFLRGFIIAYAKYVGIDPKDVIQAYHEKIVGKKEPADPPQEASLMKGVDEPHELITHPRLIPGWKVVSSVFATLFVFLVVSMMYIGKKSTDRTVSSQTQQPLSEIPTPLENDKKVDAPEITIAKNESSSDIASQKITSDKVATLESSADTSKALPVDESFPHEILVEGNERTWIKVVIDDTEPHEFFLPKDEKVTYKAKTKIKVVLGNATGSKVFYNGQENQGVKFSGTIRSYIFPPNSKFPQDVPSERSPSSGVVDSPQE